MVSQTFQLVMRTDPTPNKVFELTTDHMTIGRDASNDIVINDPEISRKHARLAAQVGGYILEDLGSTNGTFVNGQRLIGPHLLRPGELIMLGENVTLAFDVMQFDPDATVVASYNLPTYPTPPQAAENVPPPAVQPQQFTPPPVVPQAPQVKETVVVQTPVYAGQIPAGPEEIQEEEGSPKKVSRNWIIAGVGCLLVTICVCVAAAYAFDTINLYCVPPFDSLFSWLYTCP